MRGQPIGNHGLQGQTKTAKLKELTTRLLLVLEVCNVKKQLHGLGIF